MLDLISVCRLLTVKLRQIPILCDYNFVRGKFYQVLTRGISFILKTTTPWCSGVSSVILPRCAFTTWFPYRKGISPFGFIHTWYCESTISKDFRTTIHLPCTWHILQHSPEMWCAAWICRFCWICQGMYPGWQDLAVQLRSQDALMPPKHSRHDLDVT